MKDDNFTDEQKMLLQVVTRNVKQLENLTTDVLNFKAQIDAMHEVTSNQLSDQEVSQHVLRDSRHQCCCNKM